MKNWVRRMRKSGAKHLKKMRGRRKLKRQPVQYFKRTLYSESLISVPAFTAVNGVVTLTLASVPDYTDFTNLYDAYQIKAIKVTFIPRITSVEQTGSLTNQVAQIHTVLDYDDGLPLSSIQDYVQYESYKTSRLHREHKRYFVPAIESTAQKATGTVVPAIQLKKQWLDCDVVDIAHHGCKWLIQGGSQDTVYDTKITFYMAFKQVI